MPHREINISPSPRNKHILRVDYHFHPNLSRFMPFFSNFLCKKKAQKTWKGFKKYNLDVVLVAEHAYKNPRKSFEILEKNKPKNAKTIIIPAIEVLSKEGTDIIAFAKNKKDIYSKKELLTPYKLTIKEFIDLIKKDKKLFGIVVHPHTPGTTSIIRNNGAKTTKEAIRKLGLLEAHNYSYSSLIKIFKLLKLNKIFKKKYTQMLETQNAPASLRKEAKVLTGGSDAHNIFEMGDYMKISVEKEELNDIFEILTTKSGEPVSRKEPVSGLIISSLTVLQEWIIKKLHLYTIDKPCLALYNREC